MKVITATELKTNLGKYLEAARSEEVAITRNGACIAKLCSASTVYSRSEPENDDLCRLTSRLMALREPENFASYDVGGGDEWTLACNGEPVARLTPIKRKRRLGFIDGPPASEETIAAIMEPVMTEKELDEWEKKPL